MICGLIIAEVPLEHSLVWTEQMMPVMPVVRVQNVDEGIALAVRAEHGFRHTASVYSNDVSVITRMAKNHERQHFCRQFGQRGGSGGRW